MAKKDQTSEETLKEAAQKAKEETSKETAGEKETPSDTESKKETTESKVDYETKFKESQKEALRLYKQNKTLKDKLETSVSDQKKKKESKEKPDLDKLVEKKVQEKIAPLTEQQTKERVDGWLEKTPGAYDYLKEIDEAWPNSPGRNVEEKLENAYLVAKKDAMKDAGKKELAFALYQKAQAAASGGGVSASRAEEGPPSLSEKEKEVAQKLRLEEEDYQKRKSEVERNVG